MMKTKRLFEKKIIKIIKAVEGWNFNLINKMDQQQVNFNIDPDKIDAKFCDQVLLNSGAFGFSFDFVQQIPHMKMSRVLSRIAMSPQHAKIFSELLVNNVKAYEENFGEIKLSTKMKDEAQRPIGFQERKAETK